MDSARDALGHYRCDIQALVINDRQAIAKMLLSSMHRKDFLGLEPTSKRVERAGAALLTFQDNSISDPWVLGDLHRLYQRLECNQAEAHRF